MKDYKNIILETWGIDEIAIFAVRYLKTVGYNIRFFETKCDFNVWYAEQSDRLYALDLIEMAQKSEHFDINDEIIVVNNSSLKTYKSCSDWLDEAVDYERLYNFLVENNEL